jgi:hypothetical protein
LYLNAKWTRNYSSSVARDGPGRKKPVEDFQR